MPMLFTSESVSEGHPDKICDLISDSILDACLKADPSSRVACEVLVKSNHVILAGEITTTASLEYESIVRNVVRQIGYTDPEQEFNADSLDITNLIAKQTPELGNIVDPSIHHEQGAGDQGIMFGFATDETPEFMPLPIMLAHKLTYGLAMARHDGRAEWLRPDSKSQVTVRYLNGKPAEVTHVLVSTQHSPTVGVKHIDEFVRSEILEQALGEWYNDKAEILCNPSGPFTIGGPSADAGLTGRKIIADTYGGFSRHGGGAFSGKDPSKVDRSGAYFCRYVARQIIKQGLASKAEVQVAYAIGRAKPISILVDTFGTSDKRDAEQFVSSEFDFRPSSIIRDFNLLQPIYTQTTNYGHFGKTGLPWES